MTFLLEHAAVFLALAATACGAGWWAVRRLPVGGRLEGFVLATSLGLVVLAQIGLFLGLAGWLRPLPVLGVAGVAVLSLLAGVFRKSSDDSRAASTPGSGYEPPACPVGAQFIAPAAVRSEERIVLTGGTDEGAMNCAPTGHAERQGKGKRWRRAAGVVALAALALAPFAVMSLYPPTGFDATLYHLPYARAFAESGGLPFLPDLRFPVFPQAIEVLFALVMLFSDDVAAHGVELLASLLTAALVYVWGRELSGAVAGWGAAAVFLGNPIVAHLSGDAYIDAGLTLFTTAALYAVWRWRRGEGSVGWLALATAFGSGAAASKYLGLFFLGLVGLAALFPVRGSGAAARLRAIAVSAAVTLAVAGPWYGRLAAWTGNPLFPYAPDLFGASDWDPVNFRTFASLTAEDLPPEPPTSPARHAGRAVSLVRLPWDVVFARHRFGQQPPYSPVYLIALPLALLLAWRDPRLRPPLLIAGIYAFVCLALPPDSRYLLPAAPLVSLAAGAVLARALALPAFAGRARRRPGWLAAAVCAGCFLPAWCYGIYRIQRQGPVPVTAERREEYLARRLPLYPAVAHLNRRYGAGRGATVYGLWAEEMTYYSENRFLGDWYGPASYRQLLRNVRSAADLRRSLKRYGAGVLLVAAGRQPLPVPEDAEFHRLFRQVYADPYARIFELTDPPG